MSYMCETAPKMRARFARYSLGIASMALGAVQAQSPSPSSTGNPIPVTPDNFVRAETDMYFAQFAKRGGFGKFNHSRDLPLGESTGVRPNRAWRDLRCGECRSRRDETPGGSLVL